MPQKGGQGNASLKILKEELEELDLEEEKNALGSIIDDLPSWNISRRPVSRVRRFNKADNYKISETYWESKYMFFKREAVRHFSLA